MDNIITQTFLLFLYTTAQYTITLFGVFFVFGFILSELQEKTHEQYNHLFGWKGILFTAWIGTPIHEIGHIFFAKIFRHQIDKFSLFSPNHNTGGLGHVNHSFNPKSLYQRIGNFFIGAAPLFFGSIVLIILAIIFFPHSINSLPSLSNIQNIGIYINTLISFIQKSNLNIWQWLLFIYLSFCVVSHMAPSKQDRSNMWDGFFFLVSFVAIYTGITMFANYNGASIIHIALQPILDLVIPLWTYALILSFIHYLFITFFFLPLRIYKKRRLS